MDVIDRILGSLEDNFADEDSAYVLAFRGQLCVRPVHFHDWMELLYADAVEEARKSLSIAGYDEALRRQILSGEGSDETFGVDVYLFDSTDAYETFIDRFADDDGMFDEEGSSVLTGEDYIDAISELDGMCSVIPDTVFDFVCREPSVKTLIERYDAISRQKR